MTKTQVRAHNVGGERRGVRLEGFLKLLQYQFLLAVVGELVGVEQVAVVEGRQVVDVYLSRLDREEKESQAGSGRRSFSLNM